MNICNKTFQEKVMWFPVVWNFDIQLFYWTYAYNEYNFRNEIKNLNFMSPFNKNACTLKVFKTYSYEY